MDTDTEGRFVLDIEANPHPALLEDALLIRGNARAAAERLGPLKDYDIDWRIAWRYYLRAMSKATGCPPEDFDAWLDRHEA